MRNHSTFWLSAIVSLSVAHDAIGAVAIYQFKNARGPAFDPQFDFTIRWNIGQSISVTPSQVGDWSQSIVSWEGTWTQGTPITSFGFSSFGIPAEDFNLQIRVGPVGQVVGNIGWQADWVADPSRTTYLRSIRNVGGSPYRAVLIDHTPNAWFLDGDGSWSVLSNWIGAGGVPNAPDATANFGDAITSSRVVSVDTPITVGTLKFDNTNRYTLGGSSTLTLSNSSGGASISVLAGSHTISNPLVLTTNTSIAVSPATSVLTISGDLSASAPGVTITKAGSGLLELKHARVAGLSISTGTVKLLPSGGDAGTSKVENLLISGSNDAWNSKLDLADHAVVVDYTAVSPLSTLQNQVKSGFNLGDWTGNGITTSSAIDPTLPFIARIGVAEATEVFSVFPTMFRGQAVDETSVIVAYTLAGDATLDGAVNINDFSLLAANFGRLGKRWASGDFDYDGTVTIGDFSLLAANFGKVLPQGGLRSASVPEPAVSAFLLMAAAIGNARRRSHVG